jgi:hypothetical protein
MWREPSIGFWSLGSFLVTLSIAFHLISIQYVNISENALARDYYRFALTSAYLSFWAFGVSHMIARRSLVDTLGISILSINLGILLHIIWMEDFVVIISDGIVHDQKVRVSNYYISLFVFLVLLVIIIARDSYLIYRASIVTHQNNYHRSIAITHLLAWQFWGLGTIVIRNVGSDIPHLIFPFLFIFLLVPIITLGSRPFDWAREGYEPILLLVIDEYGTPTFSWTVDSSSPLIMEGSSIATINNMLSNIANETVQSMNVNYKNTSMYIYSTKGYLTLLITTGYHRSFMKLLSKIHQILVRSIVIPTEFGVTSYDLPKELRWLLSQLLPDKKYTYAEEDKSWKEYFIAEKSL